MSYWTTISVEAFCGGNSDDNGNYPCGRDCPSHLCLENNICPHFAYAKTTEREVAMFPPLRLILWDRIGIWGENTYWKLRWWFWGSLWFNRRKTQRFFGEIEIVSSKDSLVIAEMEEEDRKADEEFKEWFRKVNEEITTT